MKLTRKKLRQLIKEAFISGPYGTKHIPDEDYPFHKLEKQLDGDMDMVSTAQDLAHHEDEQYQQQFKHLEDSLPLYDDDDKEIETDYIGDTQEMYRQYDYDWREILKKQIEQIAQSTLSDYPQRRLRSLRSVTHNYYGTLVQTNDRKSAESFINEIKRQGLEKYLTYQRLRSGHHPRGRDIDTITACAQGTHIVQVVHGQRTTTTRDFSIYFDYDDPSWWKTDRQFQRFLKKAQTQA